MSKWANLSSTYSILAVDQETGEIGGAVQTHQMGVGRFVLWLEAGRGAIATQSMANLSFGPMGLAMLREGIAPERIIEGLTAADENAKRRQIGVINAKGEASAFTGSGCIREAGHHVGATYSVHANMMTRPTVIAAMSAAFEAATGDLAQRMMAALSAAQAEDGDIRGMQSAALKVVSGDLNVPTWATRYDLRVDEHENPVEELARLVRLRHAQHLDSQGHEALTAGRHEEALKLWGQARAEAPELEELAYWQALTLADNHDDLDHAIAILKPMLDADQRREQWIDLIGRLAECGLLERDGVAEALLARL